MALSQSGLAPPAGARPLSPPWTTRRAALWAVLATFVVLSVLGIRDVGLSITALLDGAGDMRRLLDRMLPPRIIEPGRVVSLAIDTFLIAFVGTVLAVILSFPLGFLAASNTTPNRVVQRLAKATIVLARTVPEIVLALIFVRVFSIGVLPGILGIGLHAVGMIAKLFADAIEQVDPGPRDGVRATGAGRLQEIATGVLPQVAPSFISTALYRLEINFRLSAILGFVGAGGIGNLIRTYQGSLQYDLMLGVTLVIVALVMVTEWVSAALRRAILGTERPGRRQRPAPTFDRLRVNMPWTRARIQVWTMAAGAIAVTIVGYFRSGVSVSRFLSKVPATWDIAQRLIPRNMEWYDRRYLDALIETISMGLAATFVGIIVAIPFSFLAARNTAPGRAVYMGARVFVLLVRSLPELILAVIFVAAVGLGPFAGVMALTIGTASFSVRLFADAIEEAREGPRDGIRATGAGRMQEAFTGVTPQVMPAFVAHILYLLDINIRSSVILGIVGAGGIGFYINAAARELRWDIVGGILIMLFVVIYGIEMLATWVRKQLI